MTKHYAQSNSFSKNNNPYLYYFMFTQIVSLGALTFYPNFFFSGTYGAGELANYKSVMSITGAEYNDKTGEFKYVPENWPENWYRRATRYGTVQALIDAFYHRTVVGPDAAEVSTPNLSVQTLLYDVHQGINSIASLVLSGTKKKQLRRSFGL